MVVPKIIIEKVLKAKTAYELFPKDDWKALITEYLFAIHPDRCSLPQANDATAKLLQFKTQLERGVTVIDDAGQITYFDTYCVIKGDENLLSLSKINYTALKAINDTHFNKYIPDDMEFIKDDTLKITYPKRAVPLSSITPLPQEHINWILSRLLEFNAWTSKNNVCHAGLTPESVFIVPETHGIMIISFYHLCMLKGNLLTISGKYKHFYPSFIFKNKKASTWIDTELAKKTAVFAAGDSSGAGLKLRGVFNENWLQFVLKFHTVDSFSVFDTYRKLLSENFDKKFFPLNI